jgi:Protein of unknown function (DUF3499)
MLRTICAVARSLRGIRDGAISAFYRWVMHRVDRMAGAAGRQCSRTGCSERAEVTLTYHYGRSQVWLDDLSAERDPHAYDLCGRHAARLSVPSGWLLDDRRISHHALIAV